MDIVYVYDKDGYFDKPVLLSMVEQLEISEDRYTDEQPGDFIRAQWTGKTWIEGADDNYLKYLEGIRGGKEPSPIEEVKEELDRISDEKELTQTALAELTETMFTEINSIKVAIAELAISMQPPVPEEPAPEEPDAEGGESNG